MSFVQQSVIWGTLFPLCCNKVTRGQNVNAKLQVNQKQAQIGNPTMGQSQFICAMVLRGFFVVGSTRLQRPSSIPASVYGKEKSQDAGLRGQDNLLDGTHHRPYLITHFNNEVGQQSRGQFF